MPSLLKELRDSERNARGSSKKRERHENDSMRQRSFSSRDIDLFSKARKCIGLFPVKPRRILDFHEGAYTPSTEDISQINRTQENCLTKEK